MNSLTMDSLNNISKNDLLLLFAFFAIQQNIPILKIFGYTLFCVISYIEIKKYRDEKKMTYYMNIIYTSTKRDYTIYNNILECINNKNYQRIDIMKTYSDLLNNINNLDYDFDKINNCLDLFTFTAQVDNILYFNNFWTHRLIKETEILDIYARLVNQIHNISIIITNSNNYDKYDFLIKKELDELYLKYNYNNSIKNKLNNLL